MKIKLLVDFIIFSKKETARVSLTDGNFFKKMKRQITSCQANTFLVWLIFWVFYLFKFMYDEIITCALKNM